MFDFFQKRGRLGRVDRYPPRVVTGHVVPPLPTSSLPIPPSRAPTRPTTDDSHVVTPRSCVDLSRIIMSARSALLALGRNTAFAPMCATTMTAIGARAYSTGTSRAIEPRRRDLVVVIVCVVPHHHRSSSSSSIATGRPTERTIGTRRSWTRRRGATTRDASIEDRAIETGRVVQRGDIPSRRARTVDSRRRRSPVDAPTTRTRASTRRDERETDGERRAQ